MELFLLLSIGLSIVAFISLALNQDPAAESISDHNIESTFPLESLMMTSNKMRMLKLEDQLIAQDMDPFGQQRANISVSPAKEMYMEMPVEASQP